MGISILKFTSLRKSIKALYLAIVYRFNHQKCQWSQERNRNIINGVEIK